MKACARCGIDIAADSPPGSQCRDCDEVNPLPGRATTRIVDFPCGGYGVYSSRRGNIPPEERLLIVAEVVRLTKRNESANRIALTLGISTRTVHRIRVQEGISRQHGGDPRNFYRDPIAARAHQMAALARANERRAQ